MLALLGTYLTLTFGMTIDYQDCKKIDFKAPKCEYIKHLTKYDKNYKLP